VRHYWDNDDDNTDNVKVSDDEDAEVGDIDAASWDDSYDDVEIDAYNDDFAAFAAAP
jgi:hypothetical protein